MVHDRAGGGANHRACAPDRRAGNRGGHQQRARAGVLRGHRRFGRIDGAVYLSRVSLQTGRGNDHQLPHAAHDGAGDGDGVWRPRPDPDRLSRRHPSSLSLPQLRRFDADRVMNGPIKLELTATDGAARLGRLTTAHGAIETPAFMPVGTQAAVKAMAPGELWDIGYRMILANAYHLAVRPGADLIRELGGIQSFMGWRGAVLTDSGGFQAMSLASINRISEEGIRFRSHLDGSPMLLTPESALDIQQMLGCDIMMALDECTPYPVQPADARRSLELTARWAERSLRARTSHSQALFGIVQGSVYADLRAASARQITSL